MASQIGALDEGKVVLVTGANGGLGTYVTQAFLNAGATVVGTSRKIQSVPPLRKTGNSRIIAIGSRAALEPGAGVGAYSASKAAMVSLIRTVALEKAVHRRAFVALALVLPAILLIGL